MKKSITLLLLMIVVSFSLYSQTNNTVIPSANSNDYYYQIPESPEAYSSENVAARLVDGLGFRFYWASEGLRQEDLDFKPSENGRTSAETIDHVLGLSNTIINATTSTVNTPSDRSGMTAAEKRQLALDNIKAASENLKKASPGDIENMKSIFSRGEGQTAEFPFWNMINGPIADAVWHCGQIVTFRRSSGNPFNSKVSVFQGRVRE